MTTFAEVRLWGTTIGAVSLDQGEQVARFEYDRDFAGSGIEVSPLNLPLRANRVYRFPALAEESFNGLPGLLADSLPDRYGNALIDAWLATRRRTPESFDAVERLCYVGRRGMGALEYKPARGPSPTTSHEIDVAALAELAAEVMAHRSDLAASLEQSGKREALRQILRVGTSAGGARPKAVVALNRESGEIRSGQLDAEPGFEQWILKFDGVEDDTRDLGASRGYGAIELVYSQMAARAGIEMTECQLLEEGGRRHFLTRRFDRGEDGDKIHMQSLAALAHLDFRQAGAHSYEQAFQTIERLGLTHGEAVQQFRRMVFNVVARNQDDHVKNIGFLMDRGGNWSLSPAFDLVFAFNPSGRWTARHQMSINGKLDDFSLEDFRRVGDLIPLKRGEAETILGEVVEAVSAWPSLAADAEIGAERIAQISTAHRLHLPKR